MARYPKGSGKKNQIKSKTGSSEHANHSILDKRVADKRLEPTSNQINESSAPPKSPISNMISEAEREAQLNQIKTTEIEQKQDQKLNQAQNPTKIDEFNPEKILEIAKEHKTIINFGLEQAEPILIHISKDDNGGWLPQVKDDLTEGLSLLSAILWPEMDEMDERSKMMMMACYTVAGASIKQAKHCNKLRKAAIEKESKPKIESNNTAT